jgi:hypothetical protein
MVYLAHYPKTAAVRDALNEFQPPRCSLFFKRTLVVMAHYCLEVDTAVDTN